jgi:uncharacterized protein (UPF0332 family)
MSFSPAGLLEHAERLLRASSGGSKAPSEEDLRRAISAAYYAVFHTVVGATADLFSRFADPTKSIHERVYRKPEHKDLKNCLNKYKDLCRAKGVKPDQQIENFAIGFKDLYEKRQDADYKTTVLITLNEAETSIDLAREAIKNFHAAKKGDRNVFLSVIVFPPISNR